MDKIIIKNLVARGVIGIHAWEREQPQEILINLVLYLDLLQVGENDDITSSVSYSTIAKKVLAHAELAQRFTVEGLANDLARLCLAETGVKKVLVRVEKPGAVKFAESVGVEIERTRDD
jgi:FolB domain-containing protein